MKARDVIIAQAGVVRADYARLVASARVHRSDPAAAGAALEEIARRRLYRLGGHTSFGAFVIAELGISRETATRVRRHAPSRRERTRSENEPAETAARTLARWLRTHGLARPRLAVVRPRGVASVQLVLTPKEIARLTASRR